MLKQRMLCSASAVSVALLVGAWGTAALAQTETVSEVEGVTVTGSYIAGTPEDAAMPVQVIGREELQAQGAPSVLEILKNLPVSGPTLGESNQFSVAAQGRSGGGTINLRGLGAQRTLVLLNGRRFSGGTADTNWLPVSAIGRVEVLKDGAAATYGSDAIGGVANFITRTDVHGVELAGDIRLVEGADDPDWTVSGIAGYRGDNWNVMIAGGYQFRGQLRIVERQFTQTPYLQNPTGWSVLGNPGAWTIQGVPNAAPNNPPVTIGFAVDANCTQVGGVLSATGTTPACYFSYLPFDNLVEEQHMWQVYGELNFDITEDHRFHLEAMAASNEVPHIRFSPGYPPTSGPNGPGSVNVYSVPSHNPGFAAFLAQTGAVLPAGFTPTRALATLWRPFANGGNPSTSPFGGQDGSRLYEYLRISGGFRGELFEGFRYDAAITYIREDQNQQTTDILINRLQAALNGLGGPGCTGVVPGANGCQYFNPFSNAYPGNPALPGFETNNPGFIPANANNPALVAWLFDRQIFDATQETMIYDLVFSGELPWSLWGGQIGYAIGGQYRSLDYEQRILSDFYNQDLTPCPTPGDFNCAFRTGPYIFLGQNRNLTLGQDVWAVFGELHLPITERIDAQLAVRHEEYGGQTGNTTNPQLRVKWQIWDEFALRASVGTSFRGPTAGNVAPTGVTGLSGIAAAGNNFKSVDFFGNPAVGPESAFTYSVGAIVQWRGLQVTLDYWYYELEDQITVVPANIIATAVAGVGAGSQFVDCSHPLRNLITFNNGNTCTQGVTVGNDIARIRSDTTNGPTITTSGIDVSVSWRFPGDFLRGQLNFGADASYVLDFTQDAFIFGGQTVSPSYQAAGFTNYNRLPGTIPKWRGQFFADWRMDRHSLRYQINYIDGATDDRGPTTVQSGPSANCNVANAQAGIAGPNCHLTTFGLRVDAFVTHDVTYRLDLPYNTTFNVTVQNLFDANPAAARLELSYDPFIGNPLGRTIKFGLRTRF